MSLHSIYQVNLVKSTAISGYYPVS